MTIKGAETDLPFGLRGGSDTWDQSQASVVLDSDWFVEPAAGGPAVKYWVGSAWGLKPLKHWDGFAWVHTGTLKRWSGGAWVAV